VFAVSADNSTCVNRTLQWRWLETQKFSNASVIDLQKKKLPVRVCVRWWNTYWKNLSIHRWHMIRQSARSLASVRC